MRNKLKYKNVKHNTTAQYQYQQCWLGSNHNPGIHRF